MSVRVLILAAGSSQRFGSTDKLLADVGGRPLLTRTLTEVLRHVQPIQVAVVVAPDATAHAQIASAAEVDVVVAADAALGMRHSLLAGLGSVQASAPGVIVLLGDDPLAARALPDVLARAESSPADVIAVRRDPAVPHPVYLPRGSWPGTPDGGPTDRGLRDLLRGPSVQWTTTTVAPPIDVDEQADVATLASRLAAPDQLETERLVLRRWRDEDRESFAQLNADPRVMEHFPAPLSRAESDATIDRIETHFDTHGFGLWAVVPRGAEHPIGFTGLAVPRFDARFMPTVEVGWRLAAEAWGHGYATEAAFAALTDGFGRCDLRSIVSMTVPANVRSTAVMERLGMTHDPADDFDHPLLEPGSALQRHVLYRLDR